ncbi:MAG: hypothetical protein U9Q07_07295 [Planctomycetota bacterium]|nr:hypothetical protein [Planctomycetota bacterium]
MNDRDRENLTELFERFFDAEEAKGSLEDVREGEQIFRDNPAPEPDDMLIANIKAEIAMRLPVRRAQLARRRMYRRAATAAAILIIGAIGTLLFDGGGPVPGRLEAASLIPTAIWESNNIAIDDENLAVFAAEIDQIENEVMILESGEDTSEDASTVEEMEIELIVARNDFWKE